ncbi:MAG: GHKL domain-containing protein [Cyclobacteriaceae bacterium]|nr:GHKL domain-containing protein [Cyclobacteriaceae bacterium]
MLLKNLLILFIFLLQYFNAVSQIGFPIRKAYNINFENSTAVWSIVQDLRGVLYLATGKGIYEYDGVAFNSVSQVPAYGLALDPNGDIYVSAKNDFGVLRDDDNGVVRFESLLSKVYDSIKIGVANNVLTSSSNVYCISSRYTIEYNKASGGVRFYTSGAGSSFYNGYIKNDKLWISVTGKGLYTIDNGRMKLAPYGGYFASLNKGGMNSSLTFSNDNRVLLFSPHIIRYFDSLKRPIPFYLKNYAHSSSILYNSFSLTDNYHLVTSINHGAILFDTLGNVLNYYSDSTQFPGNNFVYATTDSNHNVWLTLENYKSSVIKTEHGQDISVWNRSIGLRGGVYSIIQFDNLVYISTDQNLYSVSKDSQVTRFFKEPKSVDNLTKFYLNSKEILLAVAGGNKVVKINGSKLEHIYDGYDLSDLYASKKVTNRLYVADQDKFGYLTFQNNEWKYIKLMPLFEDTFVTEDSNGVIWLSNDERSSLLRIEFDSIDYKHVTSVHNYTEKNGMPGNFCVPVLFDNEVLFANQKEVYFFDQNTKRFEKWFKYKQILKLISQSTLIVRDSLKQEYHMISDNRLVTVDMKNAAEPKIVFKPYRRFEDVGSIRKIMIDTHGALWCSGVDGVVKYDRSKDFKDYERRFNCLIRKVTLDNDSLLFNGGLKSNDIEKVRLQLPYHFGRISIKFAAPFFDKEEETLYSYWLEGNGETWSDWTKVTLMEFANLIEGDYTFRVKAKNIYGNESAITSLSFKVSPPWYRTFWAYVAYFILFGATALLIVRFRTYSLNKKKIDLERLVESKTKKIIQSNEELIKSEHKLREIINDLKESQDKLSVKNNELQIANDNLVKTQRQLINSEKMASLGQLTSGIAHEINNPINFIYGGVQALSQVHQELLTAANYNEREIAIKRQELDELMKSITNGVTRTTSIVKGLRTVSSPNERIDMDGKVDIKECIENSLVLVRGKLLERNVTVEKNYEHRHGIRANSPQISQILINLLDNSIYALRNKNGEKKISIMTSEIGEEVLINFHDNGGGIPPEIRDHIFEPFFTSKEVGVGTGLGLSICYSIIQRHHGKISVTSSPELGTEFLISLPKGELLFS